MNKKGFTLIELLAVIVILAIIALVAVPIILNVIEKSKKGSKESSVLGYVNAVEKQVMISKADTNLIDIESGTYSIEQLTTLSVEVKGEKPDNTSVLIINNKGQVVEGWFTYSGTDYKIYYSGKEAVANSGTDYKDKNGNLHNEIGTPMELSNTFGGTKVAPKENDTHKGIVYLDPTDLSKTCNQELTEANYITSGKKDSDNNDIAGEIKTGCMKWYIFGETNNNEYKLILDHNTTSRIKWNDSNSNVAYENSNLKEVVDDLVTTSKWAVTPRLITAVEVTEITEKTGFDASKLNDSYYYFDTNSKVQGSFNAQNRSRYDFLYNNLTKCKTDSTDYGCKVEDNNSYTGYGTAGTGTIDGYWTSTPVDINGGSWVWCVYKYGYLGGTNANNPYIGLRPVIEVSKNIVK